MNRRSNVWEKWQKPTCITSTVKWLLSFSLFGINFNSPLHPQTMVTQAYLVWRDIMTHLPGLRTYLLHIKHETRNAFHLVRRVATGKCVHLCAHSASWISRFCARSFGVGRKRGEGLNWSQKWDFNFSEIPICLCGKSGNGWTRGEQRKRAGVKGLKSWLSDEQRVSSPGDCLRKLQVIMSSGNQWGL